MCDRMTIRLHLRRIRVLEVLVDAVERLVVAVADLRTVVRCPQCGFLTARVHDRRRVRVHDLPHGGRPTILVWIRRRFVCGNCGRRHTESHPEFRGKVTRRLARQMVRDATDMSIKAVASRYDVSWWLAMRIVTAHSGRLEAQRRTRRCRILLVDETSLRRRHRYVTVVSDGETGTPSSVWSVTGIPKPSAGSSTLKARRGDATSRWWSPTVPKRIGPRSAGGCLMPVTFWTGSMWPAGSPAVSSKSAAVSNASDRPGPARRSTRPCSGAGICS